MIGVETVECYFLHGGDRESSFYTEFIKVQRVPQIPWGGLGEGREQAW